MIIALQALAGLAIVICAVLAWHNMSPRTRHCFRAVYGMLGVAGAWLCLAPLYDDGSTDVAQTLCIVGVALYMILDRRGVHRTTGGPR